MFWWEKKISLELWLLTHSVLFTAYNLWILFFELEIYDVVLNFRKMLIVHWVAWEYENFKNIRNKIF